MEENRTWLASVLFLDIVGYTKVPVDQQMATKLHFIDIVSKHVSHLEPKSCIELDTGDGCAICYLDDPEELYPVAINLLDAFSGIDTSQGISYQVRLGLNLGPIKVVEGINGEKNCVGSGINDAQRIMDFAGENQLFVSKAYFDLVSNMSSKYAEQLCHAGTRSDKHGKLHEIYELSENRVPLSQPRVAENQLEIDDEASQRIVREYAKYVGNSAAESAIQQYAGEAASLSELCQQLAGNLSEDDRYHFNEFTRYYGYSTYH